MRVLELWRYPVKSLQGERLPSAELGPLGVAGDREWALFDAESGAGLTARRDPDLLFATGRRRDDGGVEIVLPDGTATSDDAVLSEWIGRPVELRAAPRDEAPPPYRAPGTDDELVAGWKEWEGAKGAFHDNPFFRLSLVTTAAVGGWDRRRFRANVLLDGSGEEALAGRRVRLGAAELAVVTAIPRCVMVTRPQAGGIARDNTVLKTLHRERDGLLAMGAGVVRPGTVRPGDVLEPLSRR